MVEEEIERTAEVLQHGGIIVYPTDTIWGIGCDATNEEAVARIFRMKQRADTKSMLVLVDSIDMIADYVEKIPEIALKLISDSKNSLTIIYPQAKNLAPNLISTDQTIGIRVTSDDFCKKIIQKLGKPIVSTSANISGEPFPKGFTDIDQNIKEGADYLVNLRRQENSDVPPSRIIKVLLNEDYVVIR